MLQIVKYPSQNLRVKSKKVDKIDNFVAVLISEMETLLKKSPYQGLSAVQVGVPIRVFLLKIDGEIKHFINPVIKSRSKYSDKYEESCCSLQVIHSQIRKTTQRFSICRRDKVTIEYRDLDWNKKTLSAELELGALVQHEMEHLDGKLCIDNFSSYGQDVIYRRLVHGRGNIAWDDYAEEYYFLDKIDNDAFGPQYFDRKKFY
jgi:peptide deformylase